MTAGFICRIEPAPMRRAHRRGGERYNKIPLRQDPVGDIVAGVRIDDQERYLMVLPCPQLLEASIGSDLPVIEPAVRIKLDDDGQRFELGHVKISEYRTSIIKPKGLQPPAC